MNGRWFFWRLKWLVGLLIMVVIEVGPFPVSALIFLYIFIFRPSWFKVFVDRLYSER